ncbi:UPF0149 family protein [candidate division KSB1 bacterium]|nr:UPF0149 family protein [candidate division KSB1 bacterium]
MPTQKIYDNMEHIITKLNVSYLPMDVLHGFLSAVICSPTIVLPSEWLPVLLEDENDKIDFKNIKQAEKFIGALMEFYNDILNDILNDEYSPYIRSTDDKLDPRFWCHGFSFGMTLRIDEWQDDLSDELFEYLIPIYYFADPETFIAEFGDDLAAELQADIDGLLEDLMYAVPAIYVFWNEDELLEEDDNDDWIDEPDVTSDLDDLDRISRASISPLNTGVFKVGRNEPCPCGSGKKYKNCCGRGH